MKEYLKLHNLFLPMETFLGVHRSSMVKAAIMTLFNRLYGKALSCQTSSSKVTCLRWRTMWGMQLHISGLGFLLVIKWGKDWRFSLKLLLLILVTLVIRKIMQKVCARFSKIRFDVFFKKLVMYDENLQRKNS